MKTGEWNKAGNIYTINNKNGFDIRVIFSDEDSNPKDHFDSGEPELDQEVFDGIENGKYQWFMVEVQACKRGLVFASDHLGGCCYGSYQEFIDAGDYYADMVSNVLKEAPKVLVEIVIDTTI